MSFDVINTVQANVMLGYLGGEDGSNGLPICSIKV